LGQHAASLAHELNNLLTIVILQARLLSKTASLDSRNGHAVAAIQEQTQRMSRLVDDLLAYGNAHPPQPRPTDLNNLVRRTVRLHSQQLDAAGIDVVVELDRELPVLQVDLDQFQRVFINLINNAQQAVAHSLEPGRLTITTSAMAADRIQIRFADNGQGISPQILPRLFEPFFTTKRSGKGTGLGLSVCAQVVNDHGGRIWAENNGNGGAT
jgi:signal transduction histidine kinase